MQAAISKGTTLITALGDSNETSQISNAPQDTLSHFTADFAAHDKKFHWISSIIDEADDRMSTLITNFKQYDHRVTEAKTWLHQSDISLKSKLEGKNVAQALDTEEAEMYLAMIQVR